jgi:hypothetical protein
LAEFVSKNSFEKSASDLAVLNVLESLFVEIGG